MAKKITGQIKLQLPAGKANPAPPVGPALGQHGVNIMEFCKQFNAATQAQAKEALIIPVIITVYQDRSFTFQLKTPPAAILLKKAAGLHTEKKKGSGSHTPGKEKVGQVTRKQLEQIAKMKFDETVDAAINLGVDPKHADQVVRGAVVLPHGMGKAVKIAVFAKGDKAKDAEAAGADIVGAEDLAEKIQSGFMDFDKVLATPDMMGIVGRLGKVLGPRGLMPNPKVGTVSADISRAVKEQKAGKVEFRVEKAGIVHVPFGKASFDPDKLKANFSVIMEIIFKAKPQTAKGLYVKNVTVSTTMGPGIKVDVAELAAHHA